MQDKIKLLNHAIGVDRVKSQVDISEHLYNNLPTVVEGFYIATSKRELIKIIELVRELKIDYLLIGMGSKVAFTTNGFDGLVIKNRSDMVKVSGIKGKVSPQGIGVEEAYIEAESGLSLKSLSEFSLKQNLTGLEGLSQSVGTIGGSIWQNPILTAFITKVEVIDKYNEVVVKNLSQLNQEDIVIGTILSLKSKYLP